ncbi:MAG: hypothetical protein AAF830_17625 [Pseudomonadota bacterium]
MRLAILGAVLAMGGSALAWDGHADEPQIFEAATVFNLEYAADPQISPDGKSVLYVRRSISIERRT